MINEVLIRVRAFGVGIHDRYFILSDAVFPYIIGMEAAGFITKTGASVTQFHVGERVILSSALQPKGGCWAEYVAVHQDSLIAMPDKLEFTEGAAIPVPGKTALVFLFVWENVVRPHNELFDSSVGCATALPKSFPTAILLPS